MDGSVLNRDVMLAWVISLGVLWLLVEPLGLLLFALVELGLKWCTTFDEASESLRSYRLQPTGRSDQVLPYRPQQISGANSGATTLPADTGVRARIGIDDTNDADGADAAGDAGVGGKKIQ